MVKYLILTFPLRKQLLLKSIQRSAIYSGAIFSDHPYKRVLIMATRVNIRRRENIVLHACLCSLCCWALRSLVIGTKKNMSRRRQQRRPADEVAKKFVLKECDENGFEVWELREKGIVTNKLTQVEVEFVKNLIALRFNIIVSLPLIHHLRLLSLFQS